MQRDLDRFAEFYKTKHASRKLDWDHSLGTATVTARFSIDLGDSKKLNKELTVSLYQAVVLLLFNDNEKLPFRDIKEQTSLRE